MNLLFHERYARTLQTLVDKYCAPEHRGSKLDAWVFEDRRSREAAVAELRDYGVTARIRSAFKPLLTFLVEEVALGEVTDLRIAFPGHPLTPSDRFRTESYPLAGLVAPGVLRFERRTSPGLEYQVEYRLSDGSVHQSEVFVPSREGVTAAGDRALIPTGWLRVDGPAGARNERLYCEYERIFDDVLTAYDDFAVGIEPFFDRLDIEIGLAARTDMLGYRDERISFNEALHEDLYFALIERSQIVTGRPGRSLSARPGQIVLSVRGGAEAITVKMQATALAVTADRLERHPLDQAAEPIGLGQIIRELGEIEGEVLPAWSRAGTPVPALYHCGTGPGLLVTGAQHGNEASGVVGALRAARALAQWPSNPHFAVIPAENIDNYILHLDLSDRHVGELNHAARYTSLGDDLEERGPGPCFELAARRQALALSKTALHVSLHGYPAHEWVRPLAGYFPPRAEKWTIPKGFYLLMSCHSGWQSQAEALLDRVAARLSTYPGLAAFNADQYATYRAHVGESPLAFRCGILCGLSENPRQDTPLRLVTEFPDESIRGSPFIFAHDVQTETVLAAVSALAALAETFPDRHTTHN